MPPVAASRCRHTLCRPAGRAARAPACAPATLRSISLALRPAAHRRCAAPRANASRFAVRPAARWCRRRQAAASSGARRRARRPPPASRARDGRRAAQRARAASVGGALAGHARQRRHRVRAQRRPARGPLLSIRKVRSPRRHTANGVRSTDAHLEAIREARARCSPARPRAGARCGCLGGAAVEAQHRARVRQIDGIEDVAVGREAMAASPRPACRPKPASSDHALDLGERPAPARSSGRASPANSEERGRRRQASGQRPQ